MPKTDWSLGMMLPNGARVILHNDNYVLAQNNKKEFVTWAWNPEEPDSTAWGHYFQPNELLKAVQNFEARSKRRLH